MRILRTVKELTEVVDELKAKGATIGLVPTMGALHEGHISLVDRAVKENDCVITSVFVNPTQFNNAHDLATYPRTESEDVSKLEKAGVHFAFIPSVEEVYPQADTRVFNLGSVAEVMEGAMRPGHFNGVCQIVSKLFDWSKPDRAYFGEKDFQQIAVIKKMVSLLGKDLEIVECEINREPSGLARSSRNTRLSAEQLEIAPEIYRTLKESLRWKNEGLSPKEVIDRVIQRLQQVPHLKPEYYAIVDSATLQPIEDWNNTSGADSYPIGCIAVYCGDVRLIDNIKYK